MATPVTNFSIVAATTFHRHNRPANDASRRRGSRLSALDFEKCDATIASLKTISEVFGFFGDGWRAVTKRGGANCPPTITFGRASEGTEAKMTRVREYA